MHRRIPLAFLAAALSLVPAAAQQAAPGATAQGVTPGPTARRAEVGRPFLTCFSSREYGATAQNWVCSEDTRGLMYAFNNNGALQNDGASWRLIETASKSVVRSFARDA